MIEIRLIIQKDLPRFKKGKKEMKNTVATVAPNLTKFVNANLFLSKQQIFSKKKKITGALLIGIIFDGKESYDQKRLMNRLIYI